MNDLQMLRSKLLFKHRLAANRFLNTTEMTLEFDEDKLRNAQFGISLFNSLGLFLKLNNQKPLLSWERIDKIKLNIKNKVGLSLFKKNHRTGVQLHLNVFRNFSTKINLYKIKEDQFVEFKIVPKNLLNMFHIKLRVDLSSIESSEIEFMKSMYIGMCGETGLGYSLNTNLNDLYLALKISLKGISFEIPIAILDQNCNLFSKLVFIVGFAMTDLLIRKFFKGLQFKFLRPIAFFRNNERRYTNRRNVVKNENQALKTFFENNNEIIFEDHKRYYITPMWMLNLVSSSILCFPDKFIRSKIGVLNQMCDVTESVRFCKLMLGRFPLHKMKVQGFFAPRWHDHTSTVLLEIEHSGNKIISSKIYDTTKDIWFK